jgi:hypothetical protein
LEATCITVVKGDKEESDIKCTRRKAPIGKTVNRSIREMPMDIGRLMQDLHSFVV